MTKHITVLLIALACSKDLLGAGWMYFGYYPYLYDEQRQTWSHAANEVIWHQDLNSGAWYNVGRIPEKLAPDNVRGREISVYSPIENLNYTFEFSFTDPIYGIVTVGGVSFGIYYVYKRVTNTQSQILFYDGEAVYDYTLIFTSRNDGIWDGNTIDLGGVLEYYGTFQIKN